MLVTSASKSFCKGSFLHIL